jgi:hypothetical protein
MKKIKVGILGCNDVSSFFGNGLYQNAWSLGKLLDKEGSFDVTLFSKEPCSNKDTLGVKCSDHNIALLEKQDVIIQVAYSVSSKEAEALKKAGTKTILVKYGNSLCADIETYVQFSLDLNPPFDLNEWFRISRKHSPDLLLYSPHYEFQRQYIALTAGTSEKNTKQCPYIWDPFFIKAYSKIHSKKRGEEYNLEFKKNDHRNKSLAFIEPGISMNKANLVPIIMANEVHREDSGLIKKGYAFNSKKLREGSNGSIMGGRLESLKIFKDKVLSLEDRLPMIEILSRKARVLVSHQILNSLNYTHFEFALNGYPFVHNSDLLSEYGYYYEDCNVLDGKDRLKEALFHEELTSKELRIYNNGCEEMLWKHSPDNPKNISGYINLIKSVL